MTCGCAWGRGHGGDCAACRAGGQQQHLPAAGVGAGVRRGCGGAAHYVRAGDHAQVPEDQHECPDCQKAVHFILEIIEQNPFHF